MPILSFTANWSFAAAEIMLRRLDRHVAEQELDLLELAAGQMTETRACPSQIVGRQFIYPGRLGGFLDDRPKHLGVMP